MWENAQPTFRATATGSLALGHNGNLTNTRELAKLVDELHDDRGELPLPGNTGLRSTSDTDLLSTLLASHPDLSLEAAALRGAAAAKGAFSLVWMDETTLYAARDPQGIRPLVLGRLERGWVVASESAALDIVGAAYVREVEPGEIISIDEHGLRVSRFAEAKPKGCLFEYVYLARPDTSISGRSVHATRVEVGRRLAARGALPRPTWSSPFPSPAPRQRSATARRPASRSARGWSRTPTSAGRSSSRRQTIRQLGIRLKLNPLRDVIQGKSLVVVDDSIVRGNTQRALVRMLREAGAARCTCASPRRR